MYMDATLKAIECKYKPAPGYDLLGLICADYFMFEPMKVIPESIEFIEIFMKQEERRWAATKPYRDRASFDKYIKEHPKSVWTEIQLSEYGNRIYMDWSHEGYDSDHELSNTIGFAVASFKNDIIWEDINWWKWYSTHWSNGADDLMVIIDPTEGVIGYSPEWRMCNSEDKAYMESRTKNLFNIDQCKKMEIRRI